MVLQTNPCCYATTVSLAFRFDTDVNMRNVIPVLHSTTIFLWFSYGFPMVFQVNFFHLSRIRCHKVTCVALGALRQAFLTLCIATHGACRPGALGLGLAAHGSPEVPVFFVCGDGILPYTMLYLQ